MVRVPDTHYRPGRADSERMGKRCRPKSDRMVAIEDDARCVDEDKPPVFHVSDLDRGPCVMRVARRANRASDLKGRELISRVPAVAQLPCAI